VKGGDRRDAGPDSLGGELPRLERRHMVRHPGAPFLYLATFFTELLSRGFLGSFSPHHPCEGYSAASDLRGGALPSDERSSSGGS
jgi:hypothetical protein